MSQVVEIGQAQSRSLAQPVRAVKRPKRTEQLRRFLQAILLIAGVLESVLDLLDRLIGALARPASRFPARSPGGAKLGR